jgi:hypothetical protein
MTVYERDRESIRGRVRKPLQAVRREIVILPLFTVRDDRRAGGFKPLDGVSNRIFIESRDLRILPAVLCDSLDEIEGAWNAANRFGRYGDCCRGGHPVRLSRFPAPATSTEE